MLHVILRVGKQRVSLKFTLAFCAVEHSGFQSWEKDPKQRTEGLCCSGNKDQSLGRTKRVEVVRHRWKLEEEEEEEEIGKEK